MVATLAGAITPAVAGALVGPRLVPVTQRSYVVRGGDTLWSIATRLAPGSDPRPLIQAIEQANHVGPGDIALGRRLVIPSAR